MECLWQGVLLKLGPGIIIINIYNYIILHEALLPEMEETGEGDGRNLFVVMLH